MNNPLNIKEIQERYPYINWLTYSNSMMPEGLVLEENEIVSVTEPSFFASLGDLLNRTPKRTMANYMMWRIALYAARFMTTELRAGRIKFLAAITGQQVDEPRWKECIEYTSSKYIYVQRNSCGIGLPTISFQNTIIRGCSVRAQILWR